MNLDDDRLPPELRALLADLEHPPAGDKLAVRIARGERAYEAVAACLGDDDPLLAEIAEVLWGTYYEARSAKEMENQLHRIIRVLDRPDVAPGRQLGMAYKRLASVRLLQRAWADVIAVGKLGLEAFARAGLADDVEAGRLRFRMSNAYWMLGDEAAARTMLLDSLPGLRSDSSAGDDLVMALRHLAQMAMNEEDPGDAISFLTEALKYLPEGLETIVQQCEIGVELGRCLLEVQEYGETRAMLEPIVDILEAARKNKIRANASLLPQAHDIMGLAQLHLDEYDKALESFRRALRTGKKAYGQNSAEVAELYCHMQWAHQMREDHEAAERAAAQVVTIYERIGIDSRVDSRYVDALWHLAERHMDTKRFDQADKLALRMIELTEPVVGPTGPRMGQLLGLRGRIRFARGDYEAALPLLEQGLALLNPPDVPKMQYLELARMAAEIRLKHRPTDDDLGPALERTIGALKNAVEEVQEETDRLRYRLGQTPRKERS